ncbi:uncharacterized protein LOC109708238 [Ananas comosus]|uniref:Uncharacterized protein LOC109708238 n=1 Tax=Ananas comosus TaxID=4615 RepID=A0A6P5EW72_ANACO|nr:uncharacterized protein LOC109708238 [Ananas comosus]
MGCSLASSFLSGIRKCLHEGKGRALLFRDITSVGPQHELVDMPLRCRWNIGLAFRDNVRTTDIEFYRDQLDQQLESQTQY